MLKWRLVIRVIVLNMAVLLLSLQGMACFQPAPSVRLRTRALSGIITSDGKPIEGALLRLFRIDNGPHELVGNMNLSRKRRSRVSEVAADKQGKFSFGEVPVGRYVLVTSGGTTDVEVMEPGKGDNGTVVINSYGMGCQSASVIPPNGKIEL